MSTFTEPSRWRVGALCLFLALLASRAAAQTPPACQPEWIPTFGGYPFACDPDGTVLALAEFDDGQGRALFAGGRFVVTSSATNYLAKWDGWGWTKLGQGMGNTEVHALCVFDDGSGPALFLGGNFTTIDGVAANHIAKWDGTSFSALGAGTGGIPGNTVETLAVFDDGSGPALYAGGSFTTAGGSPANRIARWDGTAWSALGVGVSAPVLSLGVYDDGAGPALYVGGGFITAGGISAQRIARWDGTSWSPLGSGTTAQVTSLAAYDDGTGSALYVGGVFDSASGVVAHHIARWNGSTWSAVGSGANATVRALRVFDDGGGPALYAGGEFAIIGGLATVGIARWSSAGWSATAGGLTGTTASVQALAPFDDGHGLRLCAAGHFSAAGGTNAFNHAAWNGQGWDQLGFGLDGPVNAAAMYDDGSGPALFVGGYLRHAGSTDVRNIARWDGAHWSALPWLYLDSINCMAVYDDGTGPALFVGASYGPINLAKWNGVQWSLPAGGTIGSVHALLACDIGAGLSLYSAAGTNGSSSVSIARWDGFSWTPLGSGMDSTIMSLAVYDDGAGPALYAGGLFNTAGGVSAHQIARWTGTSWAPLGSGMSGAVASVYSLAVFDDGSGPALFAGGRFDTAGGIATQGIAKWDGSTWSALGGGLSNTLGDAYCWSMTRFDDGTGPALFVAGEFDAAGGVATAGLAKWNGTSWSDASFVHSWMPSLHVVDDGSPTGAALIFGGSFASSPAGDSFVAKWDLPLGCMPLGSSFCSPSSGGVIACPCSNPPAGVRRGCDNSSATGGAQLSATGLASLSNDLVQLTSSGETPSATSIVLQGTSQSASGALFGQGVRCVAGSLKRLYLKTAVLGSISAPEANDLSVHQASAALGDPIVAGQHRYYGVYYRDPNVLGGCPATSTFNITQQVDLLWTP